MFCSRYKEKPKQGALKYSKQYPLVKMRKHLETETNQKNMGTAKQFPPFLKSEALLVVSK